MAHHATQGETIRLKLFKMVAQRPGRTATELARAVRLYQRLPSVASELRKLAKSHHIARTRETDCGAWLYWPLNHEAVATERLRRAAGGEW